MRYNIRSRDVGARQCRAPTGVPYVNENRYKSAKSVWILGNPIPSSIPKIVLGINSNQIFDTKGTINIAKP
jgi:hypothetical protein